MALLKTKTISVLNEISEQINLSAEQNNDYAFIIPVRDFSPGWYFVEINLESSQTFTDALFIIKYRNNEEIINIPLKGGRLTKRIIWIKSKPEEITFSFGEPIIELEFSQFKFDKTILFIAKSRMGLRIYHRYRHTVRSTKLLWQAYNNSFIPDEFGVNYQYWIKEIEEKKLTPKQKIKSPPSISIIIYPSDGEAGLVTDTLSSISNQSYNNVEIFVISKPIVLDHSVLDETLIRNIKFVGNSDGRHNNLNAVITQTTGELSIFINAGDRLNKSSLNIIAQFYKKNSNAHILYGDDDQLDESGNRINPRFKPSWNPIYYFSHDYVGDCIIFKTSLIKDFLIKSNTELTDTDSLFLWCLSNYNINDKIYRIPFVISHRHYKAGTLNCRPELISRKQKLVTYFDRINALFAIEEYGSVFKISNNFNFGQKEPSVSILIPTRDNYRVLKRCITSILEKTTYNNYKIFILNNQSREKDALNYFNAINDNDRIIIVDYDHPFNFSSINNYGVSITNSDFVCLLNDDTAVINPEWLTEMVSYAIKPEIGCVGAKLYYSNGKIQHGGVVLGLGDVAGHAHRYFPGDSPGYMNRLICTQYVSAVTGACLLIRKDTYIEVGGLNEKNLTVAYNDVDFCMKVRTAGYLNLWTPHAQLYHYESMSRGADNTFDKKKRYLKEVRFMRKKWGNLLRDDPYYHPHLTDQREDFSFKF